jgi:hypothetical protein
MVGRGTRLHPEKTNLLVVDVSDNSRTHQLPGLDALFDLPAGMNLQGRDALTVERAIAALQRTQPWIDANRIQAPDQLEVAAERIDFFNFDAPSIVVPGKSVARGGGGTRGGFSGPAPEDPPRGGAAGRAWRNFRP